MIIPGGGGGPTLGDAMDAFEGGCGPWVILIIGILVVFFGVTGFLIIHILSRS